MSAGRATRRRVLALAGTVAFALAGAGRAEPPPGLSDLPLIELPAQGPPADGPRGEVFAFVSTGDGGWNGLDSRIGEVLAREGVPVVGFDTRVYYLRPRSPEGSAADLARVLRHYLETWDKRRVVLFGYSRGADAMPWMVSRLPPELVARVDGIVLLGAGTMTNFRFTEDDTTTESGLDGPLTLPEHSKLGAHRILCIHGLREPNSVCPELPEGLATVVGLDTDHGFEGDAEGLAARILDDIGSARDTGDATKAEGADDAR